MECPQFLWTILYCTSDWILSWIHDKQAKQNALFSEAIYHSQGQIQNQIEGGTHLLLPSLVPPTLYFLPLLPLSSLLISGDPAGRRNSSPPSTHAGSAPEHSTENLYDYQSPHWKYRALYNWIFTRFFWGPTHNIFIHIQVHRWY